MSGVWDCPHGSGRVDSSAPRATEIIGQVDRDGEATHLDRRLHELAVDSTEHELRPPEHLEPVVRVNVSPREIDEAFADLALYCGTTEVEISVSSNDVDLRLPDRFGSVRSDELSGISLDLDADVNLVHRSAVRAAEHAARKVRPDDQYSHATDDAPTRTV